MTCGNCGKPVEAGNAFCGSCGHPVSTGTPPPPPSATATPTSGQMVVTVPAWLSQGWTEAVGFAFSALAIGLLIQFVVTVVLLVLLQAVLGVSDIAWGETFKAPFYVFVAFHGPIEAIGMWLTSIFWIALSFKVAADRTRFEDRAGRTVWEFAGKVGIAYAIPVTILASVLDPGPLPISGIGLAGSFRGVGSEWDVAQAFFLSAAVAAAVAAIVLSWRRHRSLAPMLGLQSIRFPAVVNAAWEGARRVMRVAIVGLIALIVVGLLLDVLDLDPGIDGLVAFLLTLALAGVIWGGIDVAFVFMISAMRFFTGDVGVVGTEEPFWMWGGVVIVGIAFALGGFRAAERSGATDARAGLWAGALVGAFVAGILFAFSAVSLPTGESLAGPAVGFGLLWSVASVIGAAVWASQKGLLTSITFVTTPPPPPPEA